MKMLNRRTQPLLFLTLSGILALAYYVTGKLAASMLGFVKADASPVWPPAGIALAALLLQGRRMWPGITVGSLLLSSTFAVGIPSIVMLSSAFSVTLQALLGEALLRRWGFSTKLDRLGDVLGLVACAVIGSTLIGSTISNLSGCIFGWIPWSNFGRNWWTMWLGDGIGILLFTPFLLTLSHLLPHRFGNKLITNYRLPNLIVNYSEPLILLTLLVSVSWLVFGSKTDAASFIYPLEYLPFPLVVWAALRWSPGGAIFAYSIVSYIAILGTVQGGGPFLVNSSATLSDRLTWMPVLFLQAFMATMAIVALMLAAAVAEREQALVEVRRTAAMLRDREASLANAQRIAQLGHWDLDCATLEPPDDWEESPENHTSNLELRWSDQLYRLLGLTPGTIKPAPWLFLQAVHPEDRELVARSQRQAILERKSYCINYRIVLDNGSERTVCEQSEIHSNVISATVQDVTDRYIATLALRASVDRDRLLSEMALRIRHSLDLQEILNTTVAEVRQFFKVDRAFIGIKSAQEPIPDSPVYGQIVAESVGTEYRSILGCVLADESHFEYLKTFYATNRARALSDTASVEVMDGFTKYYNEYQIRATLNVPIVLGGELFGALEVNQCSGPRQWQEFEIDLLEKLATQVAIALQQAQLLQQVKDLNTNLEFQVEERTTQLQQKMQELQESNRLKDLFLHAVSHHLRTPVMGMLILMKNLLNKASVDSQQTVPISRSILERIVEGSEHQLGMVNALLDAHATGVKGVSLNTVPLQLPSLTSAVIAKLEPLLAKNQATLIQEIPGNLPLVFADGQQLQRVLEHLLINAIKHNHPGVKIKCKLEVVEVEINTNYLKYKNKLMTQNGRYYHCINQVRYSSDAQNQLFKIGWESATQPLEISIKDRNPHSKSYWDGSYQLPHYQGEIGNLSYQLPRSTVKMVRTVVVDDGVGISPQQRDSLFELCVQDPNNRQLTGLGLGLYISQQIIKAHGGEIGMENTPGGGSTFWFSLPVIEVVSS
ncbi:MASE1 domain-containing protein [Microcoleus sp. EPA2]|uniref:sensor histidine kinase n=1 Tax=Microcoleus sp. EPA2 TaxID=2841654 RepID=UPI00312B90A0